VHLSKPHHGLRVGELWALLADELRHDGGRSVGALPTMRSAVVGLGDDRVRRRDAYKYFAFHCLSPGRLWIRAGSHEDCLA
jgi:hypothetical protein